MENSHYGRRILNIYGCIFMGLTSKEDPFCDLFMLIYSKSLFSMAALDPVLLCL